MLQQKWIWRGRRETFQVRTAAACRGTVAEEARTALEAALEAVERAGFSPGHLIRSRLWALDAKARGEASDVRRDFLAGELRAASASFWGGENLPAGARVMFDLEALRSAAKAEKSVVEYVPAIPPPAFVRLDGMVSLSGNTDESEGLEAQVVAIAAKIHRSLAQAEVSATRIVTLSAYLAQSENPQTAQTLIRRALPQADCPLTISIVRGFSAAKKLVEIEVDAEL